jgi:hypothetical protein
MSRGKCSICTHAEKQAIDAALDAGLQQQQIAATFSVSKYALSRHKNRCLAPAAATDCESTGSQLDRWLARADEIFLRAAVDGNLAAQVSALSAAIRALQAHQKRETEEAEKQRDLPSDCNQWTAEESAKFRAYIDSIIARHDSLPAEVSEEVASEFRELDEDRGAAKLALTEQLRTHARVWVRHYSKIPANSETMRILLYHIDALKKRDEALQQSQPQEQR